MVSSIVPFDAQKHPYTPDNGQPDNDQQSDCRTVWARFRAGDQQVFDTLMTTHYQTLFRYDKRFSSSPKFVRDSIHPLTTTLTNQILPEKSVVTCRVNQVRYALIDGQIIS